MYNLENCWSEYTQKEKFAICVLLSRFIEIITDDYNSAMLGFEKDFAIRSFNEIKGIIGAIFRNKTFEEIGNMYPEKRYEDIFLILKYISQSKKDKLVNCFIKIYNDSDIMLIRFNIYGKGWIMEICNEINYKLSYDAFNR